MENVEFAVLGSLLAEGERFHAQMREKKEEATVQADAIEVKGPRERAGPKRLKLRYRDPW